ncbi:MAG: enoyl-CoA hydratase [Deltaproteobacteria bacterium]|nr:enoyl-CoA hydratase [Deltaproteobacteria bacterium]MBW2212623.1 enoyl-CoA hydratase [Deltaproteobacteria bacterium]MBW2687321.1 enoyl-CoA hydratase [Deltaproteobacteria bacterium]
MSDTVLLEVDEGVATITLNRPERLNCIDIPTLDRLVSLLDEAAASKDVRVVVLAGRGRAFCAGADQGEMVQRAAAEWEQIVDRYLDPIRRIATMDQPVIAKLHGDAVGGGLGLALACDYRLAAPEVRFCAPFVKIGLAGCDMSAGYFLPRLVGLGRATDMMMSGRFVKTEEAERIGLVTRVVAENELDQAVKELARRLAAGPPVALGFTKRAIRRSLDRDMEGEFDYEIFAQVQCLQSNDHREGLAAFREKRAPRFEGK